MTQYELTDEQIKELEPALEMVLDEYRKAWEELNLTAQHPMDTDTRDSFARRIVAIEQVLAVLARKEPE